METSSESNSLDHGRIVHLRISLSDPAVRGTLTDWLLSTGHVTVTDEVGQPEAGEQGVLTELLIGGGAPAVITAIRVLPDFIKALKTSVIIHLESEDGKQTFDLEAEGSPRRISAAIERITAALKKSAGD